MVAHMTYALYLRQSERDLHIVDRSKDPGRCKETSGIEIYVRKDYDPFTFALLPYNKDVLEAGTEKGSAPVDLNVTLDGETKSVLSYSLKRKVTPQAIAIGRREGSRAGALLGAGQRRYGRR